jgi:hypothetical protein
VSSKATFIAAIPAETRTETIVIREEQPAKLIVEMTLREATIVRALLGQCSYGTTPGLYDALNDLAEAGKFPSISPINERDIPGIRFEGRN